jgi:hypothetical protein
MYNFAIIIGAMKSGTSSLFRYLSQHPQIAACSNKEPVFFSKNLEKGFEWYLDLWQEQDKENKTLLEASTNYTMLPRFPNVASIIQRNMERYEAQFKFIYIIREPISRIESHYTHGYAEGRLLDPIEELIAPDSHLIEFTRYAKQLNEYSKRYPSEDILLLCLDDLAENAADVLKKVCSFLSIDNDFNFQFEKVYNTSNKKRSYGLQRHFLNKYPLLDSFVQAVPERLGRFILKRLIPRVKERIRLPQEMRAKALEYLKNDLVELHDKYGVDISRWGIEF